MINADTIQQLKQASSLTDVFKKYGLQPEKKGKGYFVRCPFHEDTTPSLSFTPARGLWKCFGCGASGDVLGFIQKMEQTSFVEAAKKLAELGGVSEDALVKTLPTPASESPFTDSELLNKVAGYYHKVFLNRAEGKRYLKGRGIGTEAIYSDYKLGYVDGTLLTVIPQNEAIFKQLIRLGILLDNRKERFVNCVVFPIMNGAGDVVSLYGRHISMETGGHFYLPGPRVGVFNESRLKQKQPHQVVITESIIDALSFIEHGLDYVMPIYGVNGFTSTHEALLNELKPSEVILVLDGDEPGIRASQLLKEKLLSVFSFNCHVVTLPNGLDANAFFMTHPKADFEALANENEVKSEANPVIPHLTLTYTELKNGKLTVGVKGVNQATGELLLDRLDLYSQKQREKLVQDTVKVLKLSESEAKQAVLDLIELAEGRALKGAQPPLTPEVVAMTPEEEAEALAFLKSPTLFKDIVSDYETLGYIGEETNKLLAYLVMTSRKMNNPLSMVIVSNSAAGKSSLQKATLSLCPTEDGKHFTRLTQQSLFYFGTDSLKHKCLSIEEEEGSSEAAYSLKTLLSAKVLNIASTTQDPNTGKKRADEYRTEGPVAVMVSTTSPEIEPELASRVLMISVDESERQTSSIQDEQKQARTLAGQVRQKHQEFVTRKHHHAQRLLKAGLAVVNEYAPSLQFPINQVRFRRSHEQYLDLIQTIAYLRQAVKKENHNEALGPYIEVDVEDITLATALFKQAFATTLNELKPATQEVLEKIVALCEAHKRKVFQRRQLREFGGYSMTHVQRHLKQLEELEYILPIAGGNGSRFSYELVLDSGAQPTEGVGTSGVELGFKEGVI